MPQIDRFTVSLDTELLAAFDTYIADRGYDNRSEAVRDMIRDMLVTDRAPGGVTPVVAVLTLVCNHGAGEVAKRLRACLAENADLVFGSLHVPVDEDRDTLAIGLKGPAEKVRAVADQIRAMRGVTHGYLSTVALEKRM